MEKEKKLKYLFANVKNLKPNAHAYIEILSQISDVFQPISLEIKVYDSLKFIEKFVEIADVRVMGEPQLINFNAITIDSQRGNSKFFNIEKEINFSAFGSSYGQGLKLYIINPYNDCDLNIFISLKGYSVTFDKLGSRK